MPIYYINTGTSPNAGNGDVLRTAFWKTNINFQYLGNLITSATVNLSTVTTDIIPSINNTYSLGSPSKQWKELFVSTGSIYLGNVKLSNNNGQLQIQTVTYQYNTVTNQITTETVIASYAAPTVVPDFTVTNTLTVTTINFVDPTNKIIVNTATGSLSFNDDDILTSNATQTYRNKTYEGQFLSVTTGTSFSPYSYTQAIFVTEVNSFSEVSVKNVSALTEASADFVCYNDQGDGTTFYIDMGMNSSNYNSGDYPVFVPNSGYLYTGGGTGLPSDLIMGTATTGSHLKLFSGGIGVESVRFVIHGDTGNVILGDDANLDDGINKLQVRGSTTMTGTLRVDHAIYSNCGIFVDVTATNIVFADDTIQTTAFTGTNIILTQPEQPNITSVGTLTALTVSGILGTSRGVHESFVTSTTATTTATYDCSTSQLFYHSTTGTVSNWTANFINLSLASGRATSISVVINQGNTGHYPNSIQIGGVAQTLNWQGNTNPTPSNNRTDVVTFSILNDSGTYTVLGQLTGF